MRIWDSFTRPSCRGGRAGAFAVHAGLEGRDLDLTGCGSAEEALVLLAGWAGARCVTELVLAPEALAAGTRCGAAFERAEGLFAAARRRPLGAGRAILQQRFEG